MASARPPARWLLPLNLQPCATGAPRWRAVQICVRLSDYAVALLSISNDKLPGTLVLNCAISDLACFAWLQSHSNPSPGPRRSAVDNTYSRSICQTNSSEPPLPPHHLKCQPEYLPSHRWVNRGDPHEVIPLDQSR